MGDGVMSGSVGRGGSIFSSEVPSLHQWLSLEYISFGTPKYTRSGELRRALGVSLGSATEDLPSRASNFRPSPPVATDELKQIRDSVLNASIKARERSKMFRDSINKLEKYTEATGSKKRQRTDLWSNDKTSGSSLLKIVGQPRNSFDQSAPRVEDQAKCYGTNKRFRTSAGESRVDCNSGPLSKDPLSNEKDQNIGKPGSGVSLPEERMLRLSSVGNGWDKNMMKRKRSVAIVANRSVDPEIKRTTHSELNSASYGTNSIRLSGRSNPKQAATTGSPSTSIKGKMSRTQRTGSEVQMSSEVCDGWEQSTSTNKVISLDSMPNNHRVTNSSYMIGQWGGQRQQKSSRSRRTNVVSPVTNNDEGQIACGKISPPVIGAKNSLNGNDECFESVDVGSNISKTKIKVESIPSPGLLSEGEETRGSDLKLEEKATDCIDVGLIGKVKMRPFIYPTKKNKIVLNENVGDGVRKLGRTVRGLSLSRPTPSQSEVKLENMATPKRIQSTRPEKIRSRTGRPPSRKTADGRALTRNTESDDDHEELLAAASDARKASYNSCTGRLWKKMEPIFGSVGSGDVNYMKQQLSLAELEDSYAVYPGAQYNVLGVVMHKEKADASSCKSGCDSNPIIDMDDPSIGFVGAKGFEKFSSLYQRVLSALIEEDESEGIYNGIEGVSMSFQCASDDSHCGSCNYVEADIRDRDIVDSEAESMVDFQIPKRSGDRFSCNKSVASNTTRNASMSDSLYSSGRWLGDDGISYSDSEFAGGSWQSDVAGPVPTDLTTFGTLSDSEYGMMCVDDRVVMELQSIGLYLDGPPDVVDGEDLIDREVMELKEGLCEQVVKKKDNLIKIDKAMQEDGEREKRFIEQVAMEQLIQMAYKRRMACRRNNGSKTVMRKVSKQVAVGFIKRTLTRCKTFELTGQSCFSEPALQKVLFSAPQANDSSTITSTDNLTSHGARKNRIGSSKSDFTSFSVLDSCADDLGRGYIGSPQASSRSCEQGFSDLESLSHKGKKRELLLDDVGGLSSRGPPTYGSSLTEVAKGKRSEQDRERGRVALMATARCETESVINLTSDQKPKSRPKDSTSANHPSSSLVPWENIEPHNRDRELRLNGQEACEGAAERLDFDNIDPLDISNDLNAPEDINNWFMGLQDYDSIGLEIPMDDLNMVLM